MEPLLNGLYLVGTPLGNLSDVSKRAIDVLKSVDVIACEDTREMKKLLGLLEIERGNRNIFSIHEHNEFEKSESLIDLIVEGKSIAYASDAGMPCISDPGSILVDKALDAGVFVTAIPTATALTTAVALSGFIAPGFSFLGFFPKSTKEKSSWANQISFSKMNVVFYESPRRLPSTLKFLAENLETNQRVFVCRELTKKFEETFRGSPEQAAEHFVQDVRGECVVVIEAQSELSPVDAEEVAIENALKNLRELGVSSKDAINVLSLLTKVPKNRLKEMYMVKTAD